MAQAARLNLRMQKELKLLVTDPPPGASFPLLNPDSHLSLSNLLAHIEGPEDTVYANGIFKIKIQIPDRYPFQPPVVTFATPIYHPNIDNGGRICLDILNLPPKGAWQPSLNISTVLTSIGLLLNEPNPDDGLMCEASKEYKYNRQAFDLKARSMTEKYARVETSENGTGNQNTKSHLNRSMMETEESLFKFEVKESSEARGKVGVFSRKLSLESSASNQKTGIEHSVNEGPINQVLENHIEVKTLEQHQKEMLKDNLHNGTKRKLSLYSPANQQRDGANKENSVPEPEQCLSVLNPQNISIDSSESFPVFQDINHLDSHSHQQLRRDNDDVRSLNDSTTDRRSKKTTSNPEENSLYSVDHTSDNTSVKLPLMPRPSFPESLSQSSTGPSSVCMTTSLCDKQEHKDCIAKTRSGFTSIKHKKLGLAAKRPSSGNFAPSKKDNKENMAPIPDMFLSNFRSTLSYGGKAGNCERNVASKKMCKISQKLPLVVPLAESNGSNTDNLHLHSDGDNLKVDPVKLLQLAEDHEQLHDHDKFAGQIKEQTDGSPISESVIVLDSEDSDEESCGTLRSKLCLTRKRLLGKQNAKV